MRRPAAVCAAATSAAQWDPGKLKSFEAEERLPKKDSSGKGKITVLRKNGFTLASAEAEDWGFEQPVLTHMWIKNISRVRN